MEGEMVTEGQEMGGDTGKQMNFSTAEYQQLEGIKPGASIPKIVHTGNRVVSAQDGMVTVEMGSCEFETENSADKGLKEMTGASDNHGGGNKANDLAY